MKDFLEFNENIDTTYPNLWDTMKAVLKGTFISLSALLKKNERSDTSTLTTHPRTLEQKRYKKKANTPRRSTLQEIVKFRAKINQI